MSPDLIARSCGYLGVFLTLIGLGIWGEPQFAATPQQHFASITLTIESLDSSITAPAPAPASTPITDTTITSPESSAPSSTTAPAPQVDAEPLRTAVHAVAATTTAASAVTSTEPNHPDLTLSEAKPTHATDTTLSTPPSELKTALPPNFDSAPALLTHNQSKTEPLPPPETKLAPPSPKAKKPNKANQPEPSTKPTTTTKSKQFSAKPRTKADAPKGAKARTKDRSSTTTTAAQKHTTSATKSQTTTKADPQLRSQLSSLLVREIRSHLQYPRNAVRRKLEGTVMMEFTIQNGVVTGFRMQRSSGHKILDEAARKLAQKLVRFNTHLGQLNYKVQIPIKYELL